MRTIMKFAGFATLLVVTLLSACASIPKRESSQELLERYTSYAGEPVSQFRVYSPFDSWGSIDDRHVIVYTNVNEAYLLTVAAPCIDLPFATRIGLTSRYPHTVSSGFDSLRVGRDTCRITEIRPVNYRQMRADLARDPMKRG
jgi:uncharacterized protein YceK